MKKVLFTANYNGIMCANTRRSLQHAANRWGVQYFEANEQTHPIRLGPRTVKAEAFMLCPEAEEIFVLDSDAIIRSDCPSPFETLPKDRLSVVACTPRVDPLGNKTQTGWEEWDRFMKIPGIEFVPRDGWMYFNSGMFMARRRLHEAMFAQTWAYCQVPNDLGYGDQTLFNIAAKKLNVAMNYAEEDWNYLDALWHGMDFSRPMPTWIMHAAGSPGREVFMEKTLWQV